MDFRLAPAVVAVALVVAVSAALCGPGTPSTEAPPEQEATRTDGTRAAEGAGRCRPPYPSGAVTAATVLCADPSRMERARLVRVVDGDTIEVAVDGREETVRLYGIDSPERGDACFAEASARTRELAGEEVRLEADARERDRYGRLLRYVYTPEGLSIDAVLIDTGFARAWREDGALRGALIALEAQAASAHRGCLWR